ncbi:GAF and ANTAR domain-containing protein [Kribbella sp. NPDC023855]|uniref:GAF and ANTAR domain-containing protein n=1 Tax=Kribbella sp. NPDC023855 TaxID=3154698 RepID=UPI0033FB7C01
MSTHDDSAARRTAGALHELALASAGLLGAGDVIGMTTSLLAGCTRATGASAAGMVVVRPDDGRLELLASTSHRAHELELYLLQVDEGPWVDAVRARTAVAVSGSQQIASRWPSVTHALQRAGYQAVYAAPMMWRGEALGALNLFFRDEGSADEIGEVAQMFADLVTLAIVHSGGVTGADLADRFRAALDERIVIERAKGVLAYVENVPFDEAFELLLALAGDTGEPLGEVAARIIDNAVAAD